MIGNYTPYTISATLDFRGETLGVNFGDFYPNGWGGITESPLTFTGSDPDVAPDLVFLTRIKLSPLEMVFTQVVRISVQNIFKTFNESDRKVGYDVAPKTQVPMTSSDVQRFGEGFSGGFIIYRHPKILFKKTDQTMNCQKLTIGMSFQLPEERLEFVSKVLI